MWIQIIKGYEEIATLNKRFRLKSFISGPKPKWSKLRIQELREFVRRLELLISEKDESKVIEKFLEKYAELKVELNSRIECEDTIFHLVCGLGQTKLAGILMKKSAILKIDLNSKDIYGWTAFHMACAFGNTEMV